MTAAFRNVRQKELCDHTMWFVNVRGKKKRNVKHSVGYGQYFVLLPVCSDRM